MTSNNGRRRFVGALISGAFLQGCGGGTANVQTTSSGSSSSGPSPVEVGVPGLAARRSSGQPIYIAHRGTAALYPEETYVAYDGSLLDNQPLLECDVQTLKDGGMVLMHDATVDRTTDGTGNLSGMTVQQMNTVHVDGDAWHGSNFGNQSVPLLADWVRKYKTKAILVPEDKDSLSMPGMLREFDNAEASKDHILVQCFGVSPLKLAVGSGYQGCFLDGGTSSPSVLNGTGIGWVGIFSGATDEKFKAWVASGVTVLTYTVNRRFERNLKLALGVRGFFSDDPVYLSGEQPWATQDKFASRTWSPGMLGSTGDLDFPARGKFFGDGSWGYDVTTGGYVGCLQGYLCPIKGTSDQRTYTVSVKIRFDAPNNSDQSRWASVFLGTDDRPFKDSNEVSSGYHILFRKNGTIDIYKKEDGATARWVTGISGTKIGDGEEASFHIAMAEGTVNAARLRPDGTAQYSVAVEDRTQKGGYLQLGRNGLACRFSNLSVS
jgi:glycerophosphoryl diester phosphodiesterase